MAFDLLTELLRPILGRHPKPLPKEVVGFTEPRTDWHYTQEEVGNSVSARGYLLLHRSQQRVDDLHNKLTETAQQRDRVEQMKREIEAKK